MSGRSHVTFPPAIRIGSWLEQKADTDGRFPYGSAAALVFAAAILTCSAGADARSHRRTSRPEAEATHHIRPRPESIHWPLAIPGVQYVPVADTGADKLGLVDRSEFRLHLVAALLAALEDGIEPVIDVGGQLILQRAAVTVGESQHDHLVGALGSGMDMLRIDGWIGGGDLIEAGCQFRIRRGDALPAVARRNRIGGWR